MSRDILNDIISDFNPEKFIRFFRSKNASFSPRQEQLIQYNDGNFKNSKKLGDINFKDNSLIIYSFQAEQALSEKSGKKAQYENGKKILKETQTDAGIFIYFDQSGNFRFSLIYANYLGKRRDWSTFRRFTYFVNRELTNKTFLQRIGDGNFSSLEKIKDAFSVEKVTESFYTDIANWYFWAVKNMSFPKDAEAEENGRNIAVIRLITRLIFIWFMKERGLIQGTLFDKSQALQLLKDLSAEKTTYYKAILQNLFFSTLNTKAEKRKYRFQKSFQGKNNDYMDHSIYRYESYFKDNETMLTVFKDIPYLNGGLFDCLDRPSKDNENQGEIRIDGFTDKDVGLSVPNFLFFIDLAETDLNKDYGTKNKKYKVKGIINILSSYNFTIDENDPNDQEVALDPELLGKVFENLLASFNPETASTARKATGSYYTSREIVDYMVIQSLENYLKTNLEESGELDNKLKQLFSNSDETNPFNSEQTLKIVRLIDNLRIVDPAVGSGAFPMGVLNKLVFALSKLDPNNSIWKETQLKAVESNVTDPVLSKRLKDQIEEQFTQKNFDYGRKLYLIQKCIYGVDIQQIAVEIAKLRFFISLLVDEKIDKSKENWGIEPLPNLDYKIMQGNSLLEEYEDIKLFDERLLNAKLPDEKEITETKEKIRKIERELMQYYGKNPQWMKNPQLERPSELMVYEAEFNRLRVIEKDLNKLNHSGLDMNNQQQLSLQPDEDKSQKVWAALQKLHKQLFSPSLARNEKLELKQKIDALEWRLIEETLKKQNKIKELEKIKKLENSNTKPFFLWKLYFPEVFQEKDGFDVVIGNPPYGISLDNTTRKQLVRHLGRVPDFEIYYYFIEHSKYLLAKNATLTYIIPNSFLFNVFASDYRKTLLKNWEIMEIIDCTEFEIFRNATVRNAIICFSKYATSEFVGYKNTLQAEDILELISRPTQKINKKELLISNSNWGLAFKLPLEILNVINKIRSSSKSLMTFFPDISQGLIAYDKYRGQSKDIIKSRAYHYFSKTKKSLKPWLYGEDIKKYFVRWNGKEWIDYIAGIANPRQPKFFLGPRILVREITNPSIYAGFTEDELYSDPSIITILNNPNSTVSLLYLLGVLNSKLATFYHFNASPKATKGAFPKILVKDIQEFPIVEVSNEGQRSIIEIVDKILVITNSSDYLTSSEKRAKVKDYEKQIDQLVYKLYGLTPEEIAIVEGE